MSFCVDRTVDPSRGPSNGNKKQTKNKHHTGPGQKIKNSRVKTRTRNPGKLIKTQEEEEKAAQD
jgi:hypothetical protein